MPPLSHDIHIRVPNDGCEKASGTREPHVGCNCGVGGAAELCNRMGPGHGLWRLKQRLCDTFDEYPTPCRDGGTGRRSGLKIRRPQGHGGSTPPPGTKIYNAINTLKSIIYIDYTPKAPLRLGLRFPKHSRLRYNYGTVRYSALYRSKYGDDYKNTIWNMESADPKNGLASEYQDVPNKTRC